MSFHAPYGMEGTPTEPCDDPTCAYNRHEGPHSYERINGAITASSIHGRCFRCDGTGCAECLAFEWCSHLRVCCGQPDTCEQDCPLDGAR